VRAIDTLRRVPESELKLPVTCRLLCLAVPGRIIDPVTEPG
jgi:hypothetical protein